MYFISVKKVTILVYLWLIGIFVCFGQVGTESGETKNRGRTAQNRQTISREILKREVIDREVITREIYYRFGELIDGIYIVDIQDQEYINAYIILDNGSELDVQKILGNFVIGASVIIVTAIVMPVLVPTMATKTIIAITVANTTGALVDGAIAGTMKYIETGGDLNQALISASDEFKWTSMFLSGSEITSLVLLYKVAPTLRATKYEKIADTVTEIAHRLEPNKIYRQYHAEHQYFTQTNSAGRIDSVFAPVLGRKSHAVNTRLDNTTIGDLRHMGYDVFPGDQGGHLIADRFGGSAYWDNVVPMSFKLNNGKWKEMEILLDSYIKDGKKVENYFAQAISLTPLSRPIAFRVEYDFEGQHFIKMFSNKP
jgi:hypothetical protein